MKGNSRPAGLTACLSSAELTDTKPFSQKNDNSYHKVLISALFFFSCFCFPLLHAESPPPPYSRYPMDYLKPPGELHFHFKHFHSLLSFVLQSVPHVNMNVYVLSLSLTLQ